MRTFELEEIKLILEHAPSVKILKSRNRELILLFLISTFPDTSKSHPYDFLHSKLTDHLESIQLEEDDESDLQFADSYEIKANKLLKRWTRMGFLTSFRNENGADYYQLTNHTTKTLIWLESLKKKEFVGTESKFKEVFNQLKELVEWTNDDVEKRIEILEDRKRDIEKEIDDLKISGTVDTYQEYEIIPRFQNINDTAKELLSDFKEVELNFKEISKEIYLKHTNTELSKKDVLSFTFDAIDKLKRSHQGKSFYAFWQFLIDRGLKTEWNKLIEELLVNLQEKSIEIDDDFLLGIKNNLFETGLQVYRSNDKMAEKVSNIIRESDSINKESLKKLLAEIKNLLIQSSKLPKVPDISILLEGEPDIELNFDKRLTLEKKKNRTYDQRPKVNTKNIEQSNQFKKIASKRPVNKKILNDNIVNVIKEKGQASLAEIIQEHGGINQGLPEVFGYFSVLKNFKHTFNDKKETQILFDEAKNKTIKIPEIIITK